MLTTFLIVLSAFALSYLVVFNASYFLITGIAIRQLRRQVELDTYEPIGPLQGNRFVPGVAIIVPAYNEEQIIEDNVRSLLSLEYPDREILVVNDGSTDGTAQRLIDAFDMTAVDAEYPVDLECAPVRNIYRAADEELVLIDKENGGKADALNAGVFFTEQPLFCAIDADSIIERGALQTVVEPFISRPERTVATGGAVRVANGSTFRSGELKSVSLPKNSLVRSQIVEYLRAFLLGRIGLSNLGSLLIISGAFGLFKTDVVREIGGYETESITEDMELVVRLHRHLIETDRDYDITFLPKPVVWTEAPSSYGAMSRQRRRWFRGLLDTLDRHRDAIGRRSYGVVGLFALPFFLLIEAFGALIEGAGYLLIPIFLLLGVLDPAIFGTFLLFAIGLGAVVTALALFGEVITYRRYEKPSEVVTLLAYGVIEAFIYRPWRAFLAWHGLFEYLRGDMTWGEMKRTGFGATDDDGARDQ